MKRIIDFLISLILLVILSPIMVIIGIFIKYNLGTPVLFKQTRPGFNGKPFTLYKFRSMNNQTDEQGKPLPDHLRLTRFGNALRKLSLDELPQLVNVVKGDLSLVGPRPLLMEYLPLYNDDQAKRHDVRPGITGWAQVNGRNAISWEEKFTLDVWYVNHQSLLLDFKILLLTIVKVVKSEGVNSGTNETMLPFRGSDGQEREGQG
ncbi:MULTISPECIES: sugar transferase [unclassified Bacillus (in: firmicutes)]|uniref:sugar transferase n=1 Tax=unclassified Bacillus (in: firmicutes) TaxID=185979 RepID=UPI001BE61773|nr:MULTISPECIES: sugar transferase [unclassified Bacillus (in: firmicutes)]MBT2616206.1 sugar transferase [Bacillus sp. ISL-78]MBT2628982.1 sugar transferase [Bacillus sp. ISL-101]